MFWQGERDKWCLLGKKNAGLRDEKVGKLKWFLLLGAGTGAALQVCPKSREVLPLPRKRPRGGEVGFSFVRSAHFGVSDHGSRAVACAVLPAPLETRL